MDTDRTAIVKFIIKEFFIGDNNNSALVGKKVNELKIPHEDVLRILEDNKYFIIDKVKDFKNPFGKATYIFKMIESYYI